MTMAWLVPNAKVIMTVPSSMSPSTKTNDMLHETTEHDEGSSPTTGGSVIAYFVGSVQFLLVMTNGWPREGKKSIGVIG